MRRNVKSTLLSGMVGSLLIIFLLGVFGTRTAHAQEEKQVYYFQTGHMVGPPFLEYVQALPHASSLLGYPITEAFLDLLTGRMVQYFQRGRLEFEPLNPPGSRVFRTPIGQIIYERHNPKDITVPVQDCQRAPHWQYPVCYNFFNLFEFYGGELSLGVPVSGFVMENGLFTQYFTYSRAEWHPEHPGGPTVTLADLGFIYFNEVVKEDVSRLAPIMIDNIPPLVTTMRVHAFTEKAVLQPNKLQFIYVTVQDQSGLPLAEARVVIDVRLPDGQRLQYTRTTDQSGIAKLTIKVESADIGLVEITTTTTYSTLEPVFSRTSFRIWY